MRKLILVALLLLVGCVAFQQFQKRVDCSESYEPDISVETVLAYAPVEVKDFLEATPSTPCVDRVVKRAKMPECVGTGWDCAWPLPFFWAFIGEDQTLEVFIGDVPGKGLALYYTIPGQEIKKLIVCEYMAPPRQGLEGVQGMLKDWCYADAVEIIQSNSLCKRIVNADIGKECEARFAGDANLCGNIASQIIKDRCYSEVANKRADSLICELISKPLGQRECKAGLESSSAVPTGPG